MFYIGIDLGTSSLKLILMNKNGKVEKTVSKEYPIYFPRSGWAEQNPQDWLDSTISGIKELVLFISCRKGFLL